MERLCLAMNPEAVDKTRAAFDESLAAVPDPNDSRVLLRELGIA